MYYNLLPKILINRHGVPTLNAVSREATESSVERQTSINVRTREKVLFVTLYTYTCEHAQKQTEYTNTDAIPQETDYIRHTKDTLYAV